MTTYRFTIVVEQDEDGVYIASCPQCFKVAIVKEILMTKQWRTLRMPFAYISKLGAR